MNKYHIPNLENACHVLEFISDSANGCKLKDISAHLSIPRTTALRIVETLKQCDFLSEKEEGELVLGSAVVQLGVKALDKMDVRGYARPILQQLSAKAEESSHLAILNGMKSMLVEVADSPHPIRIAARPGTLVDLHCSSTGKIFLAYSIKNPEEFCRKLTFCSHTKNTHTTIEQVLNGIEETRKNGYAMDEEEYAPGIRCIAAPVINALGKTVDALGITASTATFPKSRIPTLSAQVKKAAAEISAKLGYGL